MGKAKKKTVSKSKKKFGSVSVARAGRQDLIMMALGSAVGVLAKRLGENVLNAQTAVKIDSKVLLFGEILGGAALGYFVKHPIARGAALGIIGASSVQLAQQMGVLNGVDQISRGLVTFSEPKLLPRARPNISGASVTPSVGNVNPYGYPQPSAVGRTSLRTSQQYAGAGL